jgi:hypothetical protein
MRTIFQRRRANSTTQSNRLVRRGQFTAIVALFLLASGAVQAVPVSHKRTLHNVDYVVSGVAGVGGGTGTISVTGVSGTVTKAFLYWHGINLAGAEYDNATVTINGNSVTGVSLGDASTNCWGGGSSRAFEADVTIVVTGNGDYVIDGLSSCDGCNANGASLVVVFNDGNSSNNRDLVFLTGNDSNYPESFPGEDQGWHALLPSMSYNGGQVKAIFHLGDGQSYGDDLVTFTTNSSSLAISDTDMLWDGNSLPSAGTSRDNFGDLWDIHTFDISAAFAATGNTALHLDGQDNGNDCLGLVALLLDMPPGTAPEPPLPGSCLVPPAGMVAWYPADNNANDIQGNNNGTLQGGVTFATGKVSQAFSFDGTDGVVAIPDSATFKITQDLTIDAWINVIAFPEGGLMQILFRGDNNGHNPYYLAALRYNGGSVIFVIQDADGQDAYVNAPVLAGEWVHVAGTLENATGDMKLYVNGSLAAQSTTTIRPFADLDPAYSPGLGIGNRQSGSDVSEPFNGLIDEVEVFNRALLGSDIRAIFDAGTAGKCNLHLTGVVSRKTHGGLTPPGDLPLNSGTPATIECRSGGIPSGNHLLVFTFDHTLNASNPVGSITATYTTTGPPQTLSATGTLGTDPHQYLVTLTGVPNASHVNVALTGVTTSANATGDFSAHMDVLFGDVSLSRRTDAGDVTQVRNRTVTIPDTTNPASFRYDVNISGRIDAGDVTATRNATVTVLPP